MRLSPTELSRILFMHFGELNSEDRPEDSINGLARRITYHARYLSHDAYDDLVPLLFIACGDTAESKRPLRLADFTKILSRIQKQLFRDKTQHKESPLISDPHSRTETSFDTESELIHEIRALLSLTEFTVFEMYFVEGIKVPEISKKIRIPRPDLAKSIRKIKRRLTKHLKK